MGKGDWTIKDGGFLRACTCSGIRGDGREHKKSMSEIQQKYQNSPEPSLRACYISLRCSYSQIAKGAAAHVPQERVTEASLAKCDVVAKIWMESQQGRSTRSRAGRGVEICTQRGL
jgi:hypothetical protein